jgi:hypothetical protein
MNTVTYTIDFDRQLTPIECERIHSSINNATTATCVLGPQPETSVADAVSLLNQALTLDAFQPEYLLWQTQVIEFLAKTKG